MKSHIAYITREQLGGAPSRVNSLAARAGNTIYCAGQTGRDPKTREIKPGIRAQTLAAFDNVERVLRAAGATLDDVVRYTIYLAREQDSSDLMAILQEKFQSRVPPPITIVVVKALAMPDILVEIEPTAVVRDGN